MEAEVGEAVVSGTVLRRVDVVRGEVELLVDARQHRVEPGARPRFFFKWSERLDRNEKRKATPRIVADLAAADIWFRHLIVNLVGLPLQTIPLPRFDEKMKKADLSAF